MTRKLVDKIKVTIGDIAPSHGPVRESWRRIGTRHNLMLLDDPYLQMGVVYTANMAPSMPEYMICDGHHRIATWVSRTGLETITLGLFEPSKGDEYDYPRFRNECLEFGMVTIGDFIKQAEEESWWADYK